MTLFPNPKKTLMTLMTNDINDLQDDIVIVFFVL